MLEQRGDDRTLAELDAVGVDWADKKHDVCLCAAGSTKRERAVVPHTPAALRD
jgi:hypothetical protein